MVKATSDEAPVDVTRLRVALARLSAGCAGTNSPA